MFYEEVPEKLKTAQKYQEIRKEVVELLGKKSEHNDLICIQIDNIYVRVDIKQLQAAVASTIALGKAEIDKLEDANNTLTKVARGLLK